jgi:hypothetical protein
MNRKVFFLLSTTWMFCHQFCVVVPTQAQGCTEIHAMAQMVRANSADDLNAWKTSAGDSHRAHGIFALRYFELQPSDHAAANAVLSFIPHTEEEDSEWLLLATPLCTNEEIADKGVLAELDARRPHDLAMAVSLVPDKMFDYISYAEIAAQNLHSDYAEQMEAACRSKQAEFVDAVNRLPAARKKWFVAKIFNPNGCHALVHPEAE